tara:strand:+ start:923 stop:1195 length:273 start_codon:yes stop_codon:yes gene_type:complete
MKISPTALRKNLYQLLDHVLDSGEPIVIQRKGREIIISEKKRKDIYQIMDENKSEIQEPYEILGKEKLEGLDVNWEADWMKKWDGWLNEK